MAPVGQKLRVAVVSPAPTVRNLLQRDVKSAGHGCRTAALAEAGALLVDWVPDVLLLDPGRGESAVEDQLQGLSVYAGGVPVVLLAGPDLLAWAQQQIDRYRIAGVLQRPWRATDLASQIQAAVATRTSSARADDGRTGLGSELAVGLPGEAPPPDSDSTRLLLPFFQSLSTLTALCRGAHGRRVASMLWDFGSYLGLAEASLRELSLAGLVHDLGELDLPEELRRLPEHQLAGPELEAFRKHPERGAGLLERLPGMSRVASYVRCHHERFDGKGFPAGLAGEAIPLPARLLAVADRYDEAVHGGMFVTRLDRAGALRFLEEEAGQRFDPRVVRSFMHWLRHRDEAEKAGSFTLPLAGLRPGMRLRRDLRTADGVLLVPAGHRISTQLLQRLARLDAAAQASLRAEVEPSEG